MTSVMHHDDVPLNDTVFELVSDIQAVSFLDKGTGHAHWRIQTPAQTLLWRQSLTTLGAPGSRPDRELQVLKTIAGQPWAPKLIANVPGVGMLLPFYDGIHPTPNTLISAPARSALLGHVSSLWEMPCSVESYDYETLILGYLARTPEPAHWQPLADRLIKQAQWPTDTFRLTHHDLHADNLLLHKDRWMILDWEYAGLANPWVDAVMLDRMMTLSAVEKEQLEAVLPDIGMVHPWQEMHEWLDGLDELWRAAWMNKE
ncbi:MAG: phosphotransferase [Natronospirillum sp.]